MKLWRVYNGYNGDTAVNVLVIAETQEDAFRLASSKFQENAKSFDGKKFIYPEKYWTNLEFELLADDLTREYVGEVES